MSGVIDENGQRWDLCVVCGLFVEVDLLLHEPPSKRFCHGRGICPMCWGAAAADQGREEASMEEPLAESRRALS